MTASYSRRTDAFTTSLHSGWNNGQWRSTRHTSRLCRGEVRASAAVHCRAEIHEGSCHPDHSRRKTGSRGESSAIDGGKQPRRHPAHGRHLPFLLHWNPVARRRAAVRHGSACERNGRAREQIANAPEGEQGDVRVWQEDESPYQRLAQGFKDRGIATGSIGMEETVRFVFTEGIAKAAGQVKIASATPVTAGCRMIKSDHEIALMRLASKVTLAAYEAAYHALNEGMTQQQF